MGEGGGKLSDSGMFWRELTGLADGKTGRREGEESWEEWVGGQEFSFTCMSEVMVNHPIEVTR